MSLASESRSTAILPIVTVQHDFTSVITDVQEGTTQQEDFWVSCYKKGETSVHGKVGVSRSGHGSGTELTCRLGVEFARGSSGTYSASCPELSIPSTRIRLPKHVLREPDRINSAYTSQINAFDVSPDMTQYAIGYNDGEIRRRSLTNLRSLGHHSTSSIQNGSHPELRVSPLTYKSHLSAITSLRYFPSSKVILSASADFSMNIIDADHSLTTSPSSPARVLKGHIRSVTDTAIISRGKNVLSCAKDGTLRLWDVGGGKQIKMMGSTRYSAINKMSVGLRNSGFSITQAADGEDNSTKSVAPPMILDGEVDTEDKLVFCALSSGSFEGFDLASKSSIFLSSTDSSQRPLTAIAYSSEFNMVATGSNDGVVRVHDTRVLSIPLHSFQRNNSSIEDLAFVNSNSSLSGHHAVSIAIATEDGLPYISSLGPEGPMVDAELVGGDCDAVRALRFDASGCLWTAGDDGVLRLY